MDKVRQAIDAAFEWLMVFIGCLALFLLSQNPTIRAFTEDLFSCPKEPGYTFVAGTGDCLYDPNDWDYMNIELQNTHKNIAAWSKRQLLH